MCSTKDKGGENLSLTLQNGYVMMCYICISGPCKGTQLVAKKLTKKATSEKDKTKNQTRTGLTNH